MSLTMAYCTDHKQYLEESNCYVGLVEFLLVMQWMENGLLYMLNEPCAFCAAGPATVRELILRAVELEARGLQNGGELTTDKISLKL